MRISLSELCKNQIDDLKEVIKKHYPDDTGKEIKRKAIKILEIELSVYVLGYLSPKEYRIRAISDMLSSVLFPSFERYTKEQKKMLKTIQCLLPHMKSYKAVINIASEYNEMPEAIRQVRIDIKKDKFEWINKFLSKEKEYYQLMTSNLQFGTNKEKYAKGGCLLYKDNNNREIKKVTVPVFFNKNVSNNQSASINIQHSSREKITFTLKDLTNSAREMDKIEKNSGIEERNWETRIENIVFSEVVSGSLKDTDVVEIEGIQQWLGKLSVGKSTLMDVIAFHMAQKNSITTLIVKDVTEVFKRIDMFYELGIMAVPIVSTNNRERHINDYFQSIKEDKDTFNFGSKRSLYYLNDVCLLKNYKENNAFDLRPSCLFLSDGDEDNFNKVCPYFNRCDYHNMFHDLGKAQVFVTTIQSLIYQKLPMPVSESNMRALEFVYRRSNLIMVDESDMIQSTLDSMFIPNIEIAGSKNSWIDKLAAIKLEKFQNNRYALRISEVLHWSNELNMAQQSIAKAYWLLLNNNTSETIRKFIGRQSFTGLKLLYQLCEELIDNKKSYIEKTVNKVYKTFESFYYLYRKNDNDYSKGNEEIIKLIEIIELTGSENYFNFKLDSYINLINENYTLNIKDFHKIKAIFSFTLSIIYLEKRIINLIELSPVVRDEFDLHEDEGMRFFSGLPEDYSSVVPMPPTGIQIGFQYLSEENASRSGRLRLFRYLGVGRYILNYMNSLFEFIDGTKGAHCVLLSGTSYAPYSARYNLHLPVKYIVKSKIAPKAEITYKYRPLMKRDNSGAIFISGKRDKLRFRALKEAIEQMVEENIIDEELEDIPQERKRVLIVVGSYVEAEIVAKKLKEAMPHMGERIFALSREKNNSDEDFSDNLWNRQMLSDFAKGGGKILVAPLLAVERGHNILTQLNESKVAAFGLAIYLIRPYPNPYDISLLANRINSFSLNSFRDYNYCADTLFNEMNLIRSAAIKIQKMYFRTPLGYRTLGKSIERKRILADTIVTTWQLEGRLIRGDVAAKVVFIDASFAPSYIEGKKDSFKTSMLIGWQKLWEDYEESEDDNCSAQQIIKEMYSIKIKGLNEIEMY